MRSKLREVDETDITRAIFSRAAREWADFTESDVIVVGAGPAGLAAAMYLARYGFKTVIFERRLSFGGGIGGGGMMFHKLVIQSPADEILREVKCKVEPLTEGVFTADTAEMIAKLAAGAIDAGTKIVPGIVVDDVMFRDTPLRVTGAVVQWTSVTMAGLHVDPLGVKAQAVVDCTGHDAEVLAIVSRKIPELNIVVPGEKSMWSPEAEKLMLKNTGEVCPGLYVAGMAAAALYQTPRMGPVFGGMLLSGKKIADVVTEKCRALVPRRKQSRRSNVA
ncbi:MAG: sulfide-dependent adenosine diphosphate thiazole synthase [Candidatus Bathyarchaeia archaeon]